MRWKRRTRHEKVATDNCLKKAQHSSRQKCAPRLPEHVLLIICMIGRNRFCTKLCKTDNWKGHKRPVFASMATFSQCDWLEFGDVSDGVSQSKITRLAMLFGIAFKCWVAVKNHRTVEFIIIYVNYYLESFVRLRCISLSCLGNWDTSHVLYFSDCVHTMPV